MRTLAIIAASTAVIGGVGGQRVDVSPPPIIDMHMHALPADYFGAVQHYRRGECVGGRCFVSPREAGALAHGCHQSRYSRHPFERAGAPRFNSSLGAGETNPRNR